MKRKRKTRMVSVHVLVPRDDYLSLMDIRDRVGVSVGSSIRQAVQKFLKENNYGFKKDDITTEKRDNFTEQS